MTETERLYLEDPYRKNAEAEVAVCSEVEGGFDVELSRTLFYPEGGGQPADHGTLDGQSVIRLDKKPNGTLSHRLAGPVAGTVTLELDWARRFDHMQQHTAQHLLTAVAADRFELQTTAFHLGETRSDIEVAGAEIGPDRLAALEDRVNRHIREARPVTWRFAVAGEAGVRTRGLPEDFSGPVRLVTIEEIDCNTCGGTHVNNLAQLQAFKVVGSEPMRGGTRIFFVAGGRVLRRLGELGDRAGALTRALSCGPEEHARAVERLQVEARETGKKVRDLNKTLARSLGENLAGKSSLIVYHHPEEDMAFLRSLAGAAAGVRPEMKALLTAGDQTGVFLLIGPDALISRIGSEAARLLEGRGGGKGETFQGKYSDLGNLEMVRRLLCG